MLLPVAQGADRQSESVCEFDLGHAESLPEDLDGRDASHPGELLWRRGLGIGIRERGLHHLFIRHRFETGPVGVSAGRLFTWSNGHSCST